MLSLIDLYDVYPPAFNTLLDNLNQYRTSHLLSGHPIPDLFLVTCIKLRVSNYPEALLWWYSTLLETKCCC
jgi:hypothetical protein